MRLPSAIVVAVLIWSAARYLPPYYLELHKMDLEEEKFATQKTHADALLREMRLQTRATAEPSKAKPTTPPESHLF